MRTDAEFVEIRDASGAYAAGQRVAVFRWPDGEAFELSPHDLGAREGYRRRYGESTDQEKLAHAALRH